MIRLLLLLPLLLLACAEVPLPPPEPVVVDNGEPFDLVIPVALDELLAPALGETALVPLSVDELHGLGVDERDGFSLARADSTLHIVGAATLQRVDPGDASISCFGENYMYRLDVATRVVDSEGREHAHASRMLRRAGRSAANALEANQLVITKTLRGLVDELQEQLDPRWQLRAADADEAGGP